MGKNAKSHLTSVSVLFIGLLGFWGSMPTAAQGDEYELEFVYWSSSYYIAGPVAPPPEEEAFHLLKTSIPSGETVVFMEDDRITRMANMVWSPDGMHLAGIALFDPEMNQAPTPHLCVFGADGNLETYFEIGWSVEFADSDYDPFKWPIVWTLDNSAILFISNVREDGTLWISVANIENNTIQRVFENRWEDAIYFTDFTWSPNVDQFAINIEMGSGLEFIYVVELATSQIIELKERDGRLTAPTWSGDGRFFSFSCVPEWPSMTKLYDLMVKEITEVQFFEEENQLISHRVIWSHNGYRSAFLGRALYDWMEEPPEEEIYICDPGQTSLQTFDCEGYDIASIATFYWWPHTPYWSPDDRFLVLESRARYPYDPTPFIIVDLENQTMQVFGEQARNHDPAWRPIVHVSE